MGEDMPYEPAPMNLGKLKRPWETTKSEDDSDTDAFEHAMKFLYEHLPAADMNRDPSVITIPRNPSIEELQHTVQVAVTVTGRREDVECCVANTIEVLRPAIEAEADNYGVDVDVVLAGVSMH